jgi:hypothetical protein
MEDVGEAGCECKSEYVENFNPNDSLQVCTPDVYLRPMQVRPVIQIQSHKF